MVTKLNHTTALKSVYLNVTDNRTFAALAQDKEDSPKAARKALSDALVEQYNANKDRLAVIGTTLRKIAHVISAQKKIDEAALVKETKVSVPMAQIKKMYGIVGDTAKVAEFFGLTKEQIEAIVK